MMNHEMRIVLLVPNAALRFEPPAVEIGKLTHGHDARVRMLPRVQLRALLAGFGAWPGGLLRVLAIGRELLRGRFVAATPPTAFSQWTADSFPLPVPRPRPGRGSHSSCVAAHGLLRDR